MTPSSERPKNKRSREPDILPDGERARPGRRIEIGVGGGAGMDVTRSSEGRKKRRNIWIGAGVLGLAVITFLLSQLEPAAPSVDRDIQLFGTVERGSFVREVRGPGTLVPEQMVFVSAITGGRVEQVLVQPGEAVVDTTILVVLSNPDIELEALQAEQQLTTSRAGLLELERSLQTSLVQQRSALASAEAEFQDATREAEAYAELVTNQTVSRNEASRAQERAATARVALETEQTRLDLLESTIENQLQIQREQVTRLSSIVTFRSERVEAMRVRAGASGEIQDFDLEVGQWVMPGTTLTRVAQPGQLMAELRIPETQARDVQVGQPAIIDTRTDSIAGAVRRVDPNVQNSSVLVEVRLTEELPPGARPSLSVDGTIELERLQDVLYVARPTYGQANASVSLFKLTEDGNEAVRVTVRLGRSSVNEIEVLEGLQEGDVIILSDLSRVQDADRIRIR
jgi:multidrug resistance efflux pump